MSNQLNTSIPEEEQQAEVAMPHGAKTLYPKNAIRVHTSGNQSVHGRQQKYTVSVLQRSSPPGSQKRESPDAASVNLGR